MLDLQEIVWFLTKHKIKQIDIITNEVDKSTPSRYKQFYNLLVNNKYETEDEYAIHFKYDNANNTAYKRFRKDFKNRLVKTVLFVDMNDDHFGDAQKALQVCQEKNAIVNILLLRSARLTAIGIIEQNLPFAIKYGFIDICYNWTKHLKYNASLKGNEKDYRYYRKLFEKYEEELIWENRSLTYLEEISTPQVNTMANKGELKQLCDEFLKELGTVSDRIESPRFRYFYIKIELNSATVVNDWEKAIAIVDKWLPLLKQKEGVSPIMLNQIIYHKGISLTMLNRFKEAEEVYLETFVYNLPGTPTWFVCYYLFTYNTLLSGQYELAWTRTKEMLNHPRFNYIEPMYQEMTNIMKAYLIVLSHFGFLTLTTAEKNDLVLYKFLNEVPIFSKDKKGVNLSILILQILLFISEQDFVAASERILLLNEYRGRYFDKESEAYRSQIMIELLRLISRLDFQIKVIEHRSKSYFTKLQNAIPRDANQNHCIEFIKFEKIWEIMKKALAGDYQRQMKLIRRNELRRLKREEEKNAYKKVE